MATPKYKKQYQEMIEYNHELFETYVDLQDKYDKKPKKYKEELEEVKQKMLRVIKKNEDRLCATSENTKFMKFSQNLADKFWEEIRLNFPKIDQAVI